jgi:hypothetical protein
MVGKFTYNLHVPVHFENGVYRKDSWSYFCTRRLRHFQDSVLAAMLLPRSLTRAIAAFAFIHEAVGAA